MGKNLEELVQELMAQGKTKEEAYAICATSLERAFQKVAGDTADTAMDECINEILASNSDMSKDEARTT